jgi:hypothetical protein
MRAMSKQNWIFTFVTALVLTSGAAFADGGSDPVAPPYPEWGPSFLRFEACTADSHVAEVQMKITNFSPFDMTLPRGNYVWATKEETTATALQVFSANFTPFIALDSDEKIQSEYYWTNLLQTPTTIRGELEDGRIGDWPVTLDAKNMLQTKMVLMAQGKYTALSVNYEAANTWIKVNPGKACAPLR